MDKIIVDYIFPPIPIRIFDYCAYYEDEVEDSSSYGWGITEQEAIKQLLEKSEYEEK